MGFDHLCIWVKTKLNRLNPFMYGLSHEFRFIDLIKTDKRNLELFSLTLNTTTIKIPSIRTTSVVTAIVETS